MKNRMQDLDFEQTVAFDKVQDYEFTRKAAQRFRQVVSLDSFEDEDADVIFHYLYKEMTLVSFGDHLKRYIYERAELEEPFSEVPQEVYKDIIPGYCSGFFSGDLHAKIHEPYFYKASGSCK